MSFPVDVDAVREGDMARIASSFHVEHRRLYGYSLEDEGAPIELINVRVRAVGVTDKPAYSEEPLGSADASSAIKRNRSIYVPDEGAIKDVLTEAVACGELAPGKDPAIQAKLLINNIYGLRVYGKLQPKGPAMREMVEYLISSLKSDTAA